jgi:hypothetical protein
MRTLRGAGTCAKSNSLTPRSRHRNQKGPQLWAFLDRINGPLQRARDRACFGWRSGPTTHPIPEVGEPDDDQVPGSRAPGSPGGDERAETAPSVACSLPQPKGAS